MSLRCARAVPAGRRAARIIGGGRGPATGSCRRTRPKSGWSAARRVCYEPAPKQHCLASHDRRWQPDPPADRRQLEDAWPPRRRRRLGADARAAARRRGSADRHARDLPAGDPVGPDQPALADSPVRLGGAGLSRRGERRPYRRSSARRCWRMPAAATSSSATPNAGPTMARPTSLVRAKAAGGPCRRPHRRSSAWARPRRKGRRRDARGRRSAVSRRAAGGGDGGEHVVAYEPVWAIGTGKVPTRRRSRPSTLNCGRWRAARVGDGERLRLLYGGSVKPGNAAEILAIANVNGALVGGASLQAEGFLGDRRRGSCRLSAEAGADPLNNRSKPAAGAGHRQALSAGANPGTIMHSLFSMILLTVHHDARAGAHRRGPAAAQRRRHGRPRRRRHVGGFMTTRGSANLLTRTTRWLAGIFMATSLVLAWIAAHDHVLRVALDPRPAERPAGAPAGSEAPATSAPAAGPVDNRARRSTGTAPSAAAGRRRAPGSADRSVAGSRRQAALDRAFIAAEQGLPLTAGSGP